MENDVEDFAAKVAEINIVLEGLGAANQVALDALILAMLSTNPQVIGPMRGLIAKLEREVIGTVAEAGERAMISYSNRIAEVHALIDKAEKAVVESAGNTSEKADF
ncbi:hypothetical protein [Yanghanlia caeni]|uniref:Uncharacterized protein n=1 Tax=Yanghanlia caeni TaxID=3064283 RepID=A0ABU1D955_9BURK|nr:hypothetical protein [Alcaligenaceae bacterium LG-2]HZH56654.1 hypothetical protein [Burkholderiaceae bacterium]